MAFFFKYVVGGLINQYALTPLIFPNESVFYTLTAPQSCKKSWGNLLEKITTYTRHRKPEHDVALYAEHTKSLSKPRTQFPLSSNPFYQRN